MKIKFSKVRVSYLDVRGTVPSKVSASYPIPQSLFPILIISHRLTYRPNFSPHKFVNFISIALQIIHFEVPGSLSASEDPT